MALRVRLVCAAAVVLGLGAGAMTGVATAAQPGGHRAGGNGGFAAPSSAVKPKFRWWWPAGTVNPAEVAREIDEIADAGFGGVEIADVYDSVSVPIDPAEFGWGSPRWNAAVETALSEAKRRGISVDLTIGPHWPAAVPGLQPDDAGAAKELTYGRATVAGGASVDGSVPAPANAPAGATAFNPSPPVTPHLVRLQAARCTTDCTETPARIQRSSLIDLTARVHDGAFSWTAPAGGTWVVIASYERGTGQLQRVFDFASPGAYLPFTDPQGYVIDHFGRAGAQAVINHWNGHMLTPRIRSLLRDVGGAIFEDSLELNVRQFWTPGIAREFQRLRGYDLTPYLPVLQGKDDAVFSYGDEVTERVRSDYDRTLSDLYLQNRVRPLKRWAHSLGLELRNQAYGAPIDGAEGAAKTDIPEGESLAFGDALDRFREIAAGRDVGGKRVLSDEAGAFAGGAYDTTWQQMLATINSNYAAGVNQAVIHGFPYIDAPGAIWPGFHPFFPLSFFPGGFAEPWGPRQPTWAHVPDVAGYLARTQSVLQSGKAKVDVAIYNGRLDVGGGSELGSTPNFFSDTGLARAGYSYGFVTPGLLEERAAFVAHGRLAPRGPAYQALVIDQQEAMPLATAQRILTYARAGLPVVVVGDPPSRTTGYHDAATQDARLRAVIARLLATRGVRRVDGEAAVPGALGGLGVTAAAANDEPANLLAVHRAGAGGDAYFLYNHGTDPIDVPVTLAGNGAPYRMDAWTGAIRRIDTYRGGRGAVKLRVRLAGNDATIVSLGGRPRWPGQPHVETTTADRALVRGGRVVLRDGAPGTYSAKLSDGRTVKAKIGAVPADVGITRWHLSAEDWRPGSSATSTEKVGHELDLDGLRPWSAIPELQDASGIGRYRATVSLGAGWDDNTGAYLDLGQVYDTFRVTINGKRLPPLDQMTTRIDVGPYLRHGANVIQVEEATTLTNRIRHERPDLVGNRARRDYGLIGPVVLEPYAQVRAR